MSIRKQITIEGRTITFDFQKYAKQANASVMVTSGGTQVLVAVCASEDARPDVDFLPLGVDYVEKSYSAGRVPGGYQKREGRPSDSAALTARVIDRPLRPCFPKGLTNDIVITATVMSYEHGHNPAPLALAGASTALMISDIPFAGPVAALSIGYQDGKFVVDPLEGNQTDELEMTIACKPDAVLMVEAGAKFLSEERMLEAIEFAHKTMAPFFEMQKEIQAEIGKPKWEIASKEIDSSLVKKVRDFCQDKVQSAITIADKQERGKALKAIGRELKEALNPEGNEETKQSISDIYGKLKAELMREMILAEGKRIDGRSTKDIRPITCETKPLIRPHGSALFTRGETQALASVTLAAAEDQQRSESLWDTDLKDRFMLHYNFPPFSVGEARMGRSPGRREIGHGNLARRALMPVIPETKDFGYTVRVVSETLESNGSSSMAAVCAGTMSLLSAGVPIKSPVAGIAMGMIKDGDRSAILSDILGDEDHLGDMDFKVCGTKDGITALQMDIKIDGLSLELMREALMQAREGLEHILGKITGTISEPEKVSEFAPQIFKVKVAADKIRDLIGPGGKTIRKITSESGVKMDIEDAGMISIVAPDSVSAEAAKSLIRSYTTDPKVGDVFLGEVVRITDFGVFVELRPGMDGLCHISHLDHGRVEKVEDVVKQGEQVMVKVIDIDRQGRIKLSRKEALEEAPKS